MGITWLSDQGQGAFFLPRAMCIFITSLEGIHSYHLKMSRCVIKPLTNALFPTGRRSRLCWVVYVASNIAGHCDGQPGGSILSASSRSVWSMGLVLGGQCWWGHGTSGRAPM